MGDQIVEQLTLGVQRGELIEAAQIPLRAQMLFDIYLSNYPLAIFEGGTMEALEARASGQIRVILAGARRS
jgi:hypothetical protein